MAIKTMKLNEGNGQYTEGWHTVEIIKALYSQWKESRVLDVWFKDYPDTFKTRIFPAFNKETNEEFAVARLFKIANAGILSVLKDANGKNPIIQYDDGEEHLVGKQVNIFLYKELGTDGKEYSRAFNRFAPVTQEGEHLSYTSDDVEYHKKKIEDAYKKYEAKKSNKPAVNNEPFNNQF